MSQGERETMSPLGEGGGLKLANKCYALFEWSLTLFLFTPSSSDLSRIRILILGPQN
jgi:hypothetical protein